MKFKLLNRYSKVLVSYILGYPVFAPDSVSMIVSNSCNLRCVMCDFWKESLKISDGIKLEEFERLFEDLKSFGTRIVQLTGGEPFLRKDLVDILKAAKAKGLQTAVVTNGTLISEDIIPAFTQNIDLVYVSLDSPSKIQHENIRGNKDIFEKITQSVKLLVNAIKKMNLSTKVILCVTITPGSIHDPVEMVKLAKDLGVNGIIYNPASSVYYGHTTLKSTGSKNNISHYAYCKMIDKIITLMGNPGNLIRSNPFYLFASKGFLNGNERFYKFPCFNGGYNGPLIAFDGTVFPCCAWNGPLGNIKKQPFSEIWKSVIAKEVRQKIKRGECPVCYHHTRTFDFIWRAPLLFKNPAMLLRGYKIISRI
ncbi:MAG: radical SAM protein [Candidatus Omnitrophica bacterium]|nr:radical SAM protein [Candidatus Omnitrophota bacterium]